MGNVLDKTCRENQNTHFIFSDFYPENRAVYEKMSKNLVEPERTQTIWRMRIACWVRKATRAQAHAIARALTPTHTRTHASTRPHVHARTHTHAHTNV